MRMAVLVTGAAGMIGRRLVPRLLEKGHDVVAVIRNTGADFDLPSEQVIKGDLNEEHVRLNAVTALGKITADKRAAIHLAGIGNAGIAKTDPVLAISENVLLTARVLAAAASRGVQRCICISTGLVYGRGMTEPIPETSLPEPGSIYAASKLAAETIVRGFAADYGMSCEIARLSNVYGPESPGSTVMGKIIGQMRNGEPVEVLSQSPVRDFIFIDDVVEALCRLLTVTDQPGSFITNVSSGVGLSIGEVIAAALEISGKRPPKTPAARDIRDCMVLSNRLIAKRLGWQPAYSIHAGLDIILNKTKQRGDIL